MRSHQNRRNHRKMKNSKPKKEQGFTLIEAVIAIGVLTFGILAVASMHISAIQGNSFAGQVTEAVTLATDQLEELIALPYDHDDLSDTDGDGNGGLDDTQDEADHQSTEGGYTLYWNVAIDSVINNTRTINVIVTWRAPEVQKSVSVQRVIPTII
jgi:type IV pilus assembly protein PilV